MLGYSVGRWDDDRTLVVRTTNLGWDHFDGRGGPFTAQGEMVEQYIVNPQDGRLDYSVRSTDSAIFAEPVTLAKHWIWCSDAAVGTYDCLRAAENQCARCG